MSEPEHTDADDAEDAERTDFPPAPPDPDEDHKEAQDAEPEPEPQEASAPASEKDIEKALKAVERAGTTYRNAIGRALGEDAQNLLPCPRCNAPVAGLVFPPELAPVDDETRAAVLASIGEGAAAVRKLNPAKGVKECPTCGGWGKLAYPTKVPHVQEQTCPACNDTGYVTDEQAVSNVTPIATTTTSTTTMAVAGRVPCPLCGQSIIPGEGHWCMPAASQGTGA